MSYAKALGSGLVGSLTVTLINETVRHFANNVPRLDLMGERAITKSLSAMGKSTPSDSKIYPLAMAGDLISNSLYYSMAGAGKGKNVWINGALLGLAAGIGAVVLPGPMGLGEGPTNKNTQTRVMTVAWYLAGGLATAAVAYFLRDRKNE